MRINVMRGFSFILSGAGHKCTHLLVLFASSHTEPPFVVVAAVVVFGVINAVDVCRLAGLEAATVCETLCHPWPSSPPKSISGRDTTSKPPNTTAIDQSMSVKAIGHNSG